MHSSVLFLVSVLYNLVINDSSQSALKLKTGCTSVMHLVARETLPEPNNQGQ